MGEEMEWWKEFSQETLASNVPFKDLNVGEQSWASKQIFMEFWRAKIWPVGQVNS